MSKLSGEVFVGTLLCYCGNSQSIYKLDLGFDELECSNCGLLINVPETPEGFEEYNEYIECERSRVLDSYPVRIMAVQETREEICLRNNVENDDLLAVILEGYRSMYPEFRIFFESEAPPKFDRFSDEW